MEEPHSPSAKSLPFDVAVTVEDLLDPIPADESYTRLKEAVIQRVAKSANLMLRELFTQVELGDQTPSQLMRHMRSLLAVKRPRQPVMGTTAAGPSRPSRLFYINDKSSGLRFLVDTGAEVSVIPPLRRHRLNPSQFSLQAANSTTISTYGQRYLTLDLGLRRRFQWVFIEADVKSPIIGADFLSSFGLTVNVRHRRLTDTTTQLFTIVHSAFEEAKKALADATMLHHLSLDAHAQPILTSDASNSAVGAVLHQQVNNHLQPLAFFSQKLQPAQTRYSTFSRELLAIYLAIRHFRHLLEGRDFSVHTDHKPLTYAIKAKSDRYSPREVRHLDFISQFTADIR
ncbi:hypothetical protein SprV_0301333900 [Sparganum proliferum]